MSLSRFLVKRLWGCSYESRYSYQLVGKGRWNSLTLKKPKPKGAGKKESKMKHVRKEKFPDDSDEEYVKSNGGNGDGDEVSFCRHICIYNLQFPFSTHRSFLEIIFQRM